MRFSSSPKACAALNTLRHESSLTCDSALAAEALTRLKKHISPDTCRLQNSKEVPGMVSVFSSIGENVGTCNWPTTFSSWLRSQRAGVHLGEALLAAGAVRMGCAEANRPAGKDIDACGARLCLISPAVDVPAYLSLGNITLPECSTSCLDADAECGGTP
jgi:hypothetical protein